MTERLVVTVRFTTDHLTRYFALPLDLQSENFATVVAGPKTVLRANGISAPLRNLATLATSTPGIAVININQRAIKVTVTSVGEWQKVENAILMALAELYGRQVFKETDISQIAHLAPSAGLVL